MNGAKETDRENLRPEQQELPFALHHGERVKGRQRSVVDRVQGQGNVLVDRQDRLLEIQREEGRQRVAG